MWISLNWIRNVRSTSVMTAHVMIGYLWLTSTQYTAAKQSKFYMKIENASRQKIKIENRMLGSSALANNQWQWMKTLVSFPSSIHYGWLTDPFKVIWLFSVWCVQDGGYDESNDMVDMETQVQHGHWSLRMNHVSSMWWLHHCHSHRHSQDSLYSLPAV